MHAGKRTKGRYTVSKLLLGAECIRASTSGGKVVGIGIEKEFKEESKIGMESLVEEVEPIQENVIHCYPLEGAGTFSLTNAALSTEGERRVSSREVVIAVEHCGGGSEGAVKLVMGGDDGGSAVSVQEDEPICDILGDAKTTPRKALEVPRYGVKGTAKVPEGEDGAVFVGMRRLNTVYYIKEGHMDASMVAVTILVGVEDVIIMPDLVNTLGDDCREEFANGFI